VAILLAPLLCFSLFTGPHRARYRCDFERQSALRERQDRLRGEADELENYLGRFVHDGEFRQRVVRERLGYADRGEYVYLFEE
jgi:hypothetical protein